ncbi:MAG: competence/damage-inducible protein A [Calditrichaeota bacterium]|nr:competence/damage-inducible protein A [Calditrichota bacterium]
MNTEIISVGDELLIGQTINTNASWMGEQLLNAGIRVDWVTTVGDNAGHIETALKIAESRANVVLITGGLGPTHDDITKKVISRYFDSKMVLNRKVLENIKARFKKRGILMSQVNRDQALVPEKAKVIFNDNGTAPGLIFDRNGVTFYVMPGVPMEMKAIMKRFVIPQLREKRGERTILFQIYCTTGIAESTLFQKIGDIAEIEKYARLAFLPSPSGVKMRLMTEGQTQKAAQDALKQAEILLRKNIESYIYASGKCSLEQVVANILTQRGKTLAVAESCTGGLLANNLTNISGSSKFFDRGIISYSNQAKMQALGVPETLIAEHGAVSAQVAQAMAEGVRNTAGTDYGLSTTGIAGPTGGTPEKPVGLVFIGYSDANETLAKRFNFLSDRMGNKERSVAAALNLLREKLG